jgi:hypothetical protein
MPNALPAHQPAQAMDDESMCADVVPVRASKKLPPRLHGGSPVGSGLTAARKGRIFAVVNRATTSRVVRSILAGACALLALAFAAPAARAQTSAALGSACQTSSQCNSMYCVEGICCDSPCSASCQSCLSALTGSTNGTCRPVTSGRIDPRGLCGSPVCSGTTLSGGACNGSNGCQTASVSCAPFACNAQGNGCNTTCYSDSDCALGVSCQGSTCGSADGGGLGASGVSFDGPRAWSCAVGGRGREGAAIVLAAAIALCLQRRRRARRA